jgi:hypothetical protein
MRGIIGLLIFFSFQIIQSEEDNFKIKLHSGDFFLVSLQKDSMGVAENYKAEINVPVCEEKICYDVKLMFFWDLIGDFEGFSLIENEPLTKLDHVPFTLDDYQKLEKILKNKDLNFVKLSVNDLVDPPTTPNVDGYSGATKTTVKNEVIEGALFTCYTLWHIANDEVIDSIKHQTKNKLDPTLINKMLEKNNIQYSYFLINELTEQELYKYLDLFLKTMPKTEGYFSKNAFEKFPFYFFETKIMQEFLRINFSKLDYYTQKAIINKLQFCTNINSLHIFFLEQLESSNSFLHQNLIDLILKNPSKENLENLLDKIEKLKIRLSEKNKESIFKQGKKFNIIIQF